MTLIFYQALRLFYSFCIVLSCILTKYTGNAESCAPDKIKNSGTGTVLFNPTDVFKTCWAQEEIAILTARVIFEDLIPDPKMISVQCNEDVVDLVEYFKLIIDNVRTKTKARKRHLMLLALTDLLGGFLHHALLPMARKAYYAGAIDYVYMEKVIQLYEELKWFLRTSGQGWTKAMRITKEVKVPTIEMETLNTPKMANESCCRRLMFYEHEPIRTQKRSVNLEKGVYFPLPFFDARSRPTAIALPLKHFALRNIESKRAAYVVMKYFISAEQCLKEKKAKPEMIQKFQNNLYTWIDKDVVPKLNDDKFYSAFGGILRVQNTLRALGAKLGNKPCVSDEMEEDVGATPGVGCSSRRNKLLLIAMLVIIVAWFFIGTCFICYRMKSNRMSHSDDSKGSKPSGSSSSFSSSKWSSMLSKSSSKTDNKQLCKCCESILSDKSTPGFSSTSEYDSEKTRRRERRSLKSLKPFTKKNSPSSPCMCSPTDGPAVIDAKNSMRILPSIAEMSENSVQKDKNGSFRKISFQIEESGVSSSDGGGRICAPPWAQTKKTIPCPVLSGKTANYSISSPSTTAKSQAVDDSFLGAQPLANSSEMQDISYTTKPTQIADPTVTSLKYDSTESTQEYTTSNNTEDSAGKPNASTSGTTEEFSQDAEPVVNMDQVQVDQIEIKEERRSKDEQPDRNFYDYHTSACHSSMTGCYDLYHRTEPNKPYIFGYDFQTSTSSELSEED